jgi:hypothetical protein
LNCGHKFCSDCLIEHLKENIVKKEMDKLVCADSTCKKSLSDKEIESILKSNESLLKKYQEFTELKRLESDPLVRFCVRPGCDGWVKANNVKAKKVTCTKCNQNMCF